MPMRGEAPRGPRSAFSRQAPGRHVTARSVVRSGMAGVTPCFRPEMEAQALLGNPDGGPRPR